ncbi:N-6 DNA methylase [Pontibacter flavimaris]|uniref:site-specific DNA-methyltransferase (adenine-specific) n=1 Tax=Pontibacter flavimaris TaxID=1797110 RepID=A0A1Q5PCJ1_9BACT|nr:N-6 DNA methylase [Pontibacter flavimaris]OKL39969.1 hypothetical protein A3841_16535 [Pontibacter flavimaris]
MQSQVEPYPVFEKKAFQAFDIFRNELSPSDYSLVPFFFFLRKAGVLDRILEGNPSDVKAQLKDLVFDYVRVASTEGKLDLVFETLSPVIDRLSNTTLLDLVRFLASFDEVSFQQHFEELFESSLYRASKIEGRAGGQHLQPLELSRLVSSLANTPAGGKVYNPFAGPASLGVLMERDVAYYGQEIDPRTWALGQLRLLAHGKATENQYQLGNSVDDWNPASLKYDLIVANPPMGMRLAPCYENEFGRFKTVESFFISRALKDLKEEGKIIAVLPQGFLFRGGVELKIRQLLIEQDLLEMVISFPGGILSNTAIPFALLVINKAKADKGEVLLINADDFVERVSNKERRIQYAPLHAAITNAEESNGFLRRVSNAEIATHNYNLHPGRYFIEEIEPVKPDEPLVELGKLLKEVRGKKPQSATKGRLILLRDLKAESGNFYLDTRQVEISEIPPQAHILDRSALLLTVRWNTLKPTYFKFKGDIIYATKDILACEIDEQRVDVGYLIKELSADYVLEQIAKYRTGAVIPYISKKDLFQVKVKLPPLEVQKERLIQALLTKQSSEQAKHISDLTQMRLEMFREFASARHSLNQYLNGISSGVAATHKFLLKNNGKAISLTDKFSETLGTTVEEHLNSLKGKVKLMSELLASLEVKLAKKPVEQLDLFNLVKEAQHLFADPELFSFRLEIDKESLKNGNRSVIQPFVIINKDDFFKLFSNIVENAKVHGFGSRKGNIIKTDISYDAGTESLILVIANNGCPLPKGFNKNLYSIRGEKAGNTAQNGIGGADVAQIVRDYNGKFDLISDEDSDFPVSVKISFPLFKQ